MAAGIASVALLAGCASADNPTVATTAAQSVTPTPAPGLTVRQVASKVAGLRAKNQKLVKDLEQRCDMTKWSDSLVEAQALACSYVVQRAPLEGQFAVKTLTIANPPAEVTALLDATRKSASALGIVSSKQCEKLPTSDDCTMVETLKVNEAVENFQLAIAGWDPYL
jgi:outer membrane murein-binding lipoprotein Lpp